MLKPGTIISRISSATPPSTVFEEDDEGNGQVLTDLPIGDLKSGRSCGEDGVVSEVVGEEVACATS